MRAEEDVKRVLGWPERAVLRSDEPIRSRAGLLSAQRLASVARKEFLHILRDPMTLFFTLFIPIVELFMLGYAIDTNVRHVRTMVLDQARTQESRDLLLGFTNSEDFRIVGEVFTDRDLSEAIVAGRARVGIKIPEDYSRRLLAGETAQVLILVDGSESSVAGEAVNVGNAIALRESLQRVLGENPLPVEARPRVLFNPDTRSANFFIPGLMVVMCQMMAVMLSATSIVREKENGTLEQLFMTPVRPAELILGKLLPYLVLTFAEFCTIALFMRIVFQVPIHGAFTTLLGLALPFVLAMLGMGLWVSTRASTRDAAMQLTMGTLMPSIFLSGYVFPLDSMPPFFWYIAQLIPTTWMIDAARGVILRGAGWQELRLHAAVLWGMAVGILLFSALRFRKRLA
jgi:ABC-2 type transport system permease protein